LHGKVKFEVYFSLIAIRSVSGCSASDAIDSKSQVNGVVLIDSGQYAHPTPGTNQNTSGTIHSRLPSASAATSGPITYTITYADTNFNTSGLTAANITLNKTGNANGTVSVTSGTGANRLRQQAGSTIRREGAMPPDCQRESPHTIGAIDRL
jgi:hypothetical protein